LTSVVTTLCYGPQEKATLRRKGWALQPEIALSDLADYVSEQGNPGNAKEISEVRIELPERLLRQGLYLSDTPGIGSARRENTATTHDFLPEADAVILVTSVDAPLSEAENEFLDRVRQWVRKLFVVVNKVDLVSPQDRELALDYISTGVARVLGTRETHLFPLSAKTGLEAKLKRDDAALQRSGLPDFEAALTAFLANDRGRTFLVAILDRALLILGQRRDVAQSEHPAACSAQCGETAESNDGLIAEMDALRTALLEGDGAGPSALVEQHAPVDLAILQRAVEASQAAPSQKERAIAGGEGCPVCAAEMSAVFDFFAGWQYRLHADADARRAFAATHGFCHAHTWQFQQIASPQGIAEGYIALVESTAMSLRQLSSVAAASCAARMRELVPGPGDCPACQVLRNAAQSSVRRLLEWLESTDGQGQQERLRGICVPHLAMILACEPSQGVVARLLNEEIQQLDELGEDMRSYLLKRDARRRGLINAAEEKAWLRSLIQLVGARNAQYWWPA